MDEIMDCVLRAGGLNIKMFRSPSCCCNHVLVTEGTSHAHLSSIVEKVGMKIRAFNMTPATEGGRSSGWRIIDCGSIIIHIMSKHCRKSYAIEDLLIVL